MINVSNTRKLATWHAIAPTYDAFTVIIMATSQWIAQTKFHLQAYQQDTGTTTLIGMIDQHLRVTITPGITTMTLEIGTGSADLDLAPIILDIGLTVTVTLTEVTLDPFTDPHTTAHHATEAQAHTTNAGTHHTADTHHVEFLQTCTSSKHHYKTPERPSSSSYQTPRKSKDRKYKQVTIDDVPS